MSSLRALAERLGLADHEVAALEDAARQAKGRNMNQRPDLPAVENPWNLTATQCAVLQLAARGMGSKEVGAELGISPKTVDVHRQRIMDRMGCWGSTLRAVVLWDRWSRMGAQA